MGWLDKLLGRNRVEPVPELRLPRLDWYVARVGRYRVWVSLGDAGSSWLEVFGALDDALTTEQGAVPSSAVRSFVATYPGGTVVDQEPAIRRKLPAGARFLPDLPRVSHLLTQRDFARGTVWVPVSFAACGARPEDPRFHTTTLRNAGLDPVRVIRFGVYRPDGVVFRLDTITGGFFGESDFREWYGVADGWIEPRAEVSDLTAFSEPGSLWAWELQTPGGERFWTGAQRGGAPRPT